MRIISITIILSSLLLAGCDQSSAPAPPTPSGPETAAPPASQPVATAPEANEPVTLSEPLQAIAESIGRGETDEALTALEAYQRESPENAVDGRASFLIGLAHHQADRYAAARPHFETALEKLPNYDMVQHFLGYACFYSGDMAAARTAFEAHIKAVPAEADSHFGLGLVHLEDGRVDEAEAAFRSAMALTLELEQTDPRRFASRRRDLAKHHARLSDVHFMREDYDAARDELLRSLAIDQSNPAPYFQLSQVYRRLGRDDLAKVAQAEADAVGRGERLGTKPVNVP